MSSVGSSSKSPFFYPKIKGQLEDAVSQMNFKQVHIFQPPMLDRGAFLRSNEKSGIKVLNLVNKLGVLRSQMPMPVDFLAKQMIRVSNRDSGRQGKRTYNPKQNLEALAMCQVSDQIKFCTCASDIDVEEMDNFWVLHRRGPRQK